MGARGANKNDTYELFAYDWDVRIATSYLEETRKICKYVRVWEVLPHLHPSSQGESSWSWRGGWSPPPFASSRFTDWEFLDSGGSVCSRRFCSASSLRISCFLHRRWFHGIRIANHVWVHKNSKNNFGNLRKLIWYR